MATPTNDTDLALVATLDTSCISDALDRLGIPGQCAGIMPLDRSFQITGRAFTLQYVPTNGDGGTVGDYIDDLGPGQVPVLDNGARLDCTVWGDLLTITAKRRGVSGTVIDGVCRDVARATAIGYPIFSRGHWMRTGKDRVKLAAIETAVVIGGVEVRPGDVLRGDADGLVVIPAARTSAVLEAATQIRDAEDSIRERVQEGMDLVQARASTGYHQLQTRA